jgi:hypothetical protein
VTACPRVRAPAAAFRVCAVHSTTGTFSVCAFAELLVMPLPVNVSTLLLVPTTKLPAVLLKVTPVTL